MYWILIELIYKFEHSSLDSDRLVVHFKNSSRMKQLEKNCWIWPIAIDLITFYFYFWTVQFSRRNDNIASFTVYAFALYIVFNVLITWFDK